MDGNNDMSKITIRTLMMLDVNSIAKEAARLGKTFTEGSNDGVTNEFYITPDLSAGEKSVLQALIDKIGTGSIT